jgi:hypothetical protein
MDRHFTPTGNPTSDNGLLLDRHKISADRPYMFHYYYLWGVERIAAIGRRAEVGGRDWYRAGAIQLLREEEAEGGWAYVDTTSFALLFLRRATYSGLAGREQEESIPRAVVWRYTTETPPPGWEKPGFDDSAWALGAGSFGDFRGAFRQDRTEWSTADIWLRREFRWDRDPGELRLVSMHDDGVEIFLNGVLAASNAVWSQKPTEYAVAAAARATLAPERNVIAVHCHDGGGARTVDVELTDRGGLAARVGKALAPEPKPWMQRPPEVGVPFLRRWLVLGPLADRKHAEFDATPLGEDALRPVAGQRSRGLVWRDVVLPSARLDFAGASKAAEQCFYYAFTYLVAAADTDVVLWLGSDDGARVWLDERLVLSHHAHGAAKKDEIPVPLHLSAGAHALMIRVENLSGPSELYARICDLDARTPRGVVPTLALDATDLAAAARAQPGFFALAELATLLELDLRAVRDFDEEGDVAALAATGGADGFPRWDSGAVTRKRADAAGVFLNPGRKGLAVVAPESNDRPAQLFWRTRVPEQSPRFTASWAPASMPPIVDKNAAPPAPGVARLALWAFRDGERIALGEDQATATPEPDKRAWRTFAADLTPVAGDDVLLILEVHTGAALLDELALNPGD